MNSVGEDACEDVTYDARCRRDAGEDDRYNYNNRNTNEWCDEMRLQSLVVVTTVTITTIAILMGVMSL